MSKFLILGADPAGLAFAVRLMQKGIHDFTVLEAENEAGGLCRSVTVDGSALDIGGGHILDVRRPEVVKFLFQFMPASIAKVGCVTGSALTGSKNSLMSALRTLYAHALSITLTQNSPVTQSSFTP